MSIDVKNTPTITRRALAAVVACLVTACTPPIGVHRMDARAVHRELTSSELSTGTPSVPSRIVVQRRGLGERFEKDVPGVLATLHDASLREPGDRDLLFALAELSFHHAEHGGDRAYYLAAAVYAWAFLFPEGRADALNPFDPRVRLAADLYNRGLCEGFEAAEGFAVELSGGPRKLPFGTLDVSLDDAQLRWGDRRLVDFVAASELSVVGLRNRYREPGLGASLTAKTVPLDPQAGFRDFVFPRVKVPVTALLRLRDVRAGLASGHLTGALEVHPAREANVVEVGGRTVPLEIEPTSAFADALAEARPWERELSGLLRGDLMAHQNVTRLGALEPYRRDRIPVVLVHGTASSLARWAEMVNDLNNDSRVRERFQFWAFMYDTGNPILYSGMLLRESLAAAVDRLDPEGDDVCIRQMVVIGHSQGGLLTKLTVVDSGTRFWDNVMSRPFDEVEMPADTRDLLGRAMFVKPLPFVRRVVFIATPHRGSYRAGSLARWFIARLGSLPGDIARASGDALSNEPDAELRQALRQIPTSIDNMSPGHRFVRTIASLPLSPEVAAHSIIPVEGDGVLETLNDGVVEYKSAHIDGVESETVIRHSSHSTQSRPETIEEVRRILLLHAAGLARANGCNAGGDVEAR